MDAPLLLDLSHTSHTRARTGIQRVVRSLAAALGSSAVGITYDPYLDAWRELEHWEAANLTACRAATNRGARWPLAARLRGRTRRILRASTNPLLPAVTDGILVPELFSPAVAAALPRLFAQASGPRVALFHDAIALKLPELTPAKTVARFPAYLRELLEFDGIAAVSDESRDTLLAYWDWLGETDLPPVRTIPLGVEVGHRASTPSTSIDQSRGPNELPVVLCVGTIEARKNHRALLEASEQLWSRGARFTLQLIGVANRETGGAALARINALQAARRPLVYAGPVSDERLADAYTQSMFTVYPSLMEGFGLPVLESLAHGKPCICDGRGALGESARGGGCLLLDEPSPTAIGAAIERLLTDRPTYNQLAAEARARPFRKWSEYVAELSDWIRALPVRGPGRLATRVE